MNKELYKYRNFNAFSLESLSEDVIWVSSPEKLNDPFENSFHIEPDMSFQKVASSTKGVTSENYKDKQMQLINSIKKDFDIGGIFSLSESNKISIMWSHYANSHRGFCIGYKSSTNNDLGNEKCQKVKYGEFPEFSFYDMWKAIENRNNKFDRKLFEKMVLCKDINWKYEREWRVLYKQSDILVKANFPIKSITFGMFMSDSQKIIIKKLLQGKVIDLYDAYKPEKGYNVDTKKHV